MFRAKFLGILFVGGLTAAWVMRGQEPAEAGGGDDDAVVDGEAAAASVDYFHDQLAPYGQWVTREGYGAVWVPQVDPGWRPYTTGHWENTDQGFAWVGDEPWAWATFHYGRWYYDQDLGWAWLPGSVWAPAWVAWQSGGGYLGWAPLPPGVALAARAGLAAAAVAGITPGFYTFVHEKSFLAPQLAAVIVPSAQNVTIVKSTTNITKYAVVNNRIVNAGVSATRIQQVTGHPVPKVQISARSADSAGKKGAFYQPAIVTKAGKAPHTEFGKALPAQVVAQQQKSRSYAQVVARSQATSRTANNPGGNSYGRSTTPSGQSGSATSNSYRSNTSTGSSNGQSGTSSGNSYHPNSSAGTGSSQQNSQPQTSQPTHHAEPEHKPAPAPEHHSPPPPRPRPTPHN